MNVVKDEVCEQQQAPESTQVNINDLTVEQLRQIVMRQQMALQDLNMQSTFKRLDYLFKVIEFSSAFSEAFVKNCSSEIEDLITIKKE